MQLRYGAILLQRSVPGYTGIYLQFGEYSLTTMAGEFTIEFAARFVPAYCNINFEAETVAHRLNAIVGYTARMAWL